MTSLMRPLVLEKPAAELFGGLPTHCKDPLGFTWWLVTHLAMLGQYNSSGTVQSEVRSKPAPSQHVTEEKHPEALLKVLERITLTTKLSL